MFSTVPTFHPPASTPLPETSLCKQARCARYNIKYTLQYSEPWQNLKIPISHIPSQQLHPPNTRNLSVNNLDLHITVCTIQDLGYIYYYQYIHPQKKPLYIWILSSISTDYKMILFTFSIRSNQITVSKITHLIFKLLHCFLAFYPCPLKNKYLNTHSAYVPEICWWNSKMKGNSKEPVACLLVGDDLIQHYWKGCRLETAQNEPLVCRRLPARLPARAQLEHGKK